MGVHSVATPKFQTPGLYSECNPSNPLREDSSSIYKYRWYCYELQFFGKFSCILHYFKAKESHMRVKSPDLQSIPKARDLRRILIGSFYFCFHICKSPVESLWSTVPSNEVMFCAQGSNILRSRCLP